MIYRERLSRHESRCVGRADALREAVAFSGASGECSLDPHQRTSTAYLNNYSSMLYFIFLLLVTIDLPGRSVSSKAVTEYH